MKYVFYFSHVSVLIYSSLTMFNPIYDVTKGIVITTIYLRIQNVSQTWWLFKGLHSITYLWYNDSTSSADLMLNYCNAYKCMWDQ